MKNIAPIMSSGIPMMQPIAIAHHNNAMTTMPRLPKTNPIIK
jgi:hypothetical protein